MPYSWFLLDMGGVKAFNLLNFDWIAAYRRNNYRYTSKTVNLFNSLNAFRNTQRTIHPFIIFLAQPNSIFRW
jgi:hypothetical protein